MKYFFEKLEDKPISQLINENLYYKLLGLYRNPQLSIKEYISASEPRIEVSKVIWKEGELIIEGDYETRILKL